MSEKTQKVTQSGAKIRFGLRARFIVFFLLIGLIPLLTVSIVAYTRSQTALQVQIEAQFKGIVDEQEKVIMDYFEEREGDLTVISTLNRVKSMDPTQQGDALKPFFEIYGTYENIFVLNSSGFIQADGQEGLSVGTDCTGFEWWPRLKTSQNLTIAKPQISPVTGLGVIVIAMPIPDAAKEGYLCGAVLFSPIADSLYNLYGIGETGECYLVDKTGMMLTDSRFEAGTAFVKVIDTTAVNDGIANIHKEGYINYGRYLDYRGVEVFGVWHAIPEYEWILIMEIESAEAFAPINELGILMITIASVAAIAIAIIAFMIGTGLANPIIEMYKFVERIGKNDLTGSLAYKNSIETGLLAEGLRQMHGNLANMIIRNKKLASQLSIAAEELSSSAEEVSSSSENIASSQQQISKGAANQVVGITETQKKFTELTQGIRVVKQKVENIGQISDLIRNIANQTNMLALNAAIEAARAGEAGRGFNVVADQVRKLAEESRKAVQNTESMLQEISVITQQQESSAMEMLRAVDSIATVAEETSASTEESAAAAEEQASSMEMISSTSQQLLGYAEQMSRELKDIKLKEEDIKAMETEIQQMTQSVRDEVAHRMEALNATSTKVQNKIKTGKVFGKESKEPAHATPADKTKTETSEKASFGSAF
jgi:methyl-accepting chemotaxis protein